MENNAELKKELVDKVASYLYHTTYTREREEGECFDDVDAEKEVESRIWANSIWQIFSSKIEPLQQALSKLQSDLLNNYVEKSEVDFEKYSQRLLEQLQQLKEKTR